MWLKHPGYRRWIVREFAGRSARPDYEVAAAVWADAAEFGFCTQGAKRAFERADARFCGVGGKVDVAAFAVGAELEHGGFVRLGLSIVVLGE